MNWRADSDYSARPEHGGADVGSLRLGAEAASFRGAVTPATWVVLEELALAARRDPAGRLVAPLSVRALAARLGLAKDTAGSALRWLAAAGVARFEGGRRGGGRFDSGGYVLDLGSTGLRVERTSLPRPRRPDAADVAGARLGDAKTETLRRDRMPDCSAQHQLDLFPAEHRHAETPPADVPAHSRLPDPAAMSSDAPAPGVRTRVNRPADGGHEPC